MARPRLEESNPQLAIRVLELAAGIGIKPAAAALGISKNTVRALVRRQDFGWVVSLGAGNRAMMRILGRLNQ
ncbi:MAG: hypothetical protein HZC54_24830 [Verrucomicrobia bacterium]|nr:hypothetical protein [Verrucomicrobiota bacterium]